MENRRKNVGRNLWPVVERHLWPLPIKRRWSFEKYILSEFGRHLAILRYGVAVCELVCSVALLDDLCAGFALNFSCSPCRYRA